MCVETREGIGVLTTVPARVDINYEKACCLGFEESPWYNYRSTDVLRTLSLRVRINCRITDVLIHLEVVRGREMWAYRKLSSLIKPSLSEVSTILTNKYTQIFI